MRCNKTKKLLGVYIDQELPRETQEHVAIHLKGCEKCSNELQTLKLLAGFKKESRLKEPPVSYWDYFLPRVKARITSKEREDAGKSTLPLIGPSYRWIYKLAPALALASFAFFIYYVVQDKEIKQVLQQPERSEVVILDQSQTSEGEMKAESNDKQTPGEHLTVEESYRAKVADEASEKIALGEKSKTEKSEQPEGKPKQEVDVKLAIPEGQIASDPNIKSKPSLQTEKPEGAAVTGVTADRDRDAELGVSMKKEGKEIELGYLKSDHLALEETKSSTPLQKSGAEAKFGLLGNRVTRRDTDESNVELPAAVRDYGAIKNAQGVMNEPLSTDDHKLLAYEWENFLDKHPDSKLRNRALLNLAEEYEQLADQTKETFYFQKAIETYESYIEIEKDEENKKEVNDKIRVLKEKLDKDN